jgi:hypothetical protein
MLVIWTASIAGQAAPVFRLSGPTGHAATTAVPYIDGAPPGFAGGFSENTCDGCHFAAPPNTAPGHVVLTGVPDTFTPGARYDLTVTLAHDKAPRGGFQLTARMAETGAQAGTLAPGSGEDGRLKVEEQNGIAYVNQHREGASRSGSGFAWAMTWTAPEVPAGTIVQFHVAANAADNDETAEGDFVFTTVVESRARSVQP